MIRDSEFMMAAWLHVSRQVRPSRFVALPRTSVEAARRSISGSVERPEP